MWIYITLFVAVTAGNGILKQLKEFHLVLQPK
jgi:hypothetical protein